MLVGISGVSGVGGIWMNWLLLLWSLVIVGEVRSLVQCSHGGQVSVPEGGTMS